MLPRFPDFKTIEIDDRFAIESLISRELPYADFNFVEIWSWASRDYGGWTTLNGNLVVRWHDLETQELFLTFIGNNSVVNTINVLIDHAKDEGLEPRLQAVPESVLQALGSDRHRFNIEIDRDNWDYVLSTQEWSTIPGARFKNKRNAIHRLERNHQPIVREIDLTAAENRLDVMRVSHLWAKLRNRTTSMTLSEFTAIDNLLTFAAQQPDNRLYVIGVYVHNELVGFSVNEELPGGYGLGHFAKADYRYEGIYAFLLRQVARHMCTQGIEWLNIEADLGDVGLAAAKRLCHPVSMMRKYAISRIEDASAFQPLTASPELVAARGEG